MKLFKKKKIEYLIFITFIVLISFSFIIELKKEMRRDTQDYVKVDNFSECTKVGLESQNEYLVIVGDDPSIFLPQISGDYLEIVVKLDNVIEGGNLSIYYDIGNGFSETFHEVMEQRSNQEYSLKIKPYINSIRIDFDGFQKESKIELNSVEAIRNASEKEEVISFKLIFYFMTTIVFVSIIIFKRRNLSSMLMRAVLFGVCEKEMLFDLQDTNSVYYSIWLVINVCLVVFIALYNVGEEDEAED